MRLLPLFISFCLLLSSGFVCILHAYWRQQVQISCKLGQAGKGQRTVMLGIDFCLKQQHRTQRRVNA